MAADLDYVPMPDSVVALIEKSWKEKIKGAGSKFLALMNAGKGARWRLSLFLVLA